MVCLLSKSTNPYFNLSLEEYLFKNFSEEVFLIWRSEPAVVVGKHQNAYAEINLPYVHKHNIHVARRLSGGGTVVHDKGNINFTFIRNGQEGRLVDFRRHVKPIIDYLQTLGVNAKIGSKNEILANGLKISGNAEHIYKNRILHHGTLLFDSDLQQLHNAIKLSEKKYFDRSVQSNRAEVINIKGLLHNELTTDNFELNLFQYIREAFKCESYQLSSEEINRIELQAENKYQTKEWIFGYFSKYRFYNKTNIDGSTIEVELNVEKSRILTCLIKFSNGNSEYFKILQDSLPGKKHLFDEIKSAIAVISESGNKNNIEKLTYCFF